MIDIFNDIEPPKFILVNRFPRKKDINTIYVKKVKDYYEARMWSGEQWLLIDKIKFELSGCEENK